MYSFARGQSVCRAAGDGDVVGHAIDQDGLFPSLHFAGTVDLALFFSGEGEMCRHCHGVVPPFVGG